MGAYYNENDPFAAAWLRELIKVGLIADGEVDDRSIKSVRPDDLRGFTQCHFFAGIGGWSYALRLAGWPDERAVWTGSCPCQPFSSAGTQTGGHDPRDLWPAWFQLVRECRPVVVFGEQVEAAITHGWLDRVCDDLEREGYAVGACGLPAASVGAFHIRQRLWFVADAHERHAIDGGLQRSGEHGLRAEGGRADGHARDAERSQGILAESDGSEREARLYESVGATSSRSKRTTPTSLFGDMAYSDRGRLEQRDERQRPVSESHQGGNVGDFTSGGRRECWHPAFTSEGGHADSPSGMGYAGEQGLSNREREKLSGPRRQDQRRAVAEPGRSFWSAADWLPCRDGKARPVEPGTFPLAHGLPGRVGRLRGYGNAIVPQVAQVFIEAYLEYLEIR